MKKGISYRILALLATTAVVAISPYGCMSAQQAGDETRQFAPRLSAIPPSKRIRVEVAEWNMQGTAVVQSNGNSYYQSKEADVSQNKLTLDGIPWGRPLYFRVSGIDTTNSVVWSSAGAIPDVQQPTVTIGSGGYQPQTVGSPAIQSGSDPLAPLIQCGFTSSGSNWPAWTIDGSTASERNANTRFEKSSSQVVVALSPGQILSARCTDNFNWSPPVAYQAPNGPSSLPTQSGPGFDFALSPSIFVPSASSGTITFSANTISFMEYTDWKLAYRMNTTGSWLVQELTAATGVSFNGTGTIEAYLVAWNTIQARWGSGPSATKTYGPNSTDVEIVAWGGPLPSLVIHGTSSLPGICTFSFATPAAMSADHTNWKVVHQLPGDANWVVIDTGKSVPFDISGNMSAYLQAWSISNQRWVSGPMNTLYVPPALVVDPPVFKDANGNKLDSTWEQDGATIDLQIAGSGTIHYTTNHSDPMPGMPGTSIWDPTQKLTFPLDISTLTIKAVAQTAGTTSNPARLVIRRPLWTRQDNSDAGCVQSDGRLLAACGDATGPWRWDTTGNKWKPLDPLWQAGQVQRLLLTTKFVFATTRTGGVHRLERAMAEGGFVELDVRSRPDNLGGLAVVRDTLWASTATGPYFFDAAADTWAAPALPAATSFHPKEGPSWSNGGVLWMAFGPDLWRYAPSNGGPAVWEQWNSTYPNISWLGPDPFSTASSAMSYGTNFGQIGTARMIASGNYLNNPNGASIVQIASHGGDAYAATDNTTGSGGVVRATGWSAQYWSSPEREWPSISNRYVSSQGVAVFSARGKTWLLATTPQGTYTLKLK